MNNVKPPLVSIVIVTFNSAGVIRDCLSALEPCLDHEVIVIDNNSTDETLAIVRAHFPHVVTIQNPENSGFGSAVNTAATKSRGSNIMLLNPDAVITSSAVTELAFELEHDATIGVIAPFLIHGEGELLIVAAGRAPTVWRMFLHQSGLSRLGGKISAFEGNYLFQTDFAQSPRDVDWTSGGCFMTPREIWNINGGLTDRWFMYAEDVEFCLRVRASGGRVVVVPRITASHAVGGSSANVDGRVNTMWLVNLFDLYTWRMAPSGLHSKLWKLIVTVGMTGRKFVYGAQSHFRSGAPRTIASSNARRYAIYLAALKKAQPASTQERFGALGTQSRNLD